MSLDSIGLSVVQVPDVAALVGGRVDPTATTNLIQLSAEHHDWEAGRHGDVVVRPTWIHWVSPSAGGSAAVLMRQSLKQRQLCRSGKRAVDALTLEVSEPIDPELFRQWLEIYAARIGEMRYGRNFAAFHRRSITAPDSGHGLALWRRDGRIACGVVYRIDRQRSALIGRYGAVAASERGEDLPRGMYMAIADMAVQRGLRWATLGGDPNFYGAFLNAGLCTHKMRLGFWPVPGDLMGRTDSRDVAERVVALSGLEPPVLRFEYQTPRRHDAAIEDFLDTEPLSLVSVTPPAFRSQVFDSLPQHRRLVLSY